MDPPPARRRRRRRSAERTAALVVIYVVVGAWGISVVADIILPTYDPPVAMFGAMTTLAGGAAAFLFLRNGGSK